MVGYECQSQSSDAQVYLPGNRDSLDKTENLGCGQAAEFNTSTSNKNLAVATELQVESSPPPPQPSPR